jgi:hypothetical protein
MCLEVGPPFRRREDLTAWAVEPEDTPIARQQVGKDFPAAKNTHPTIEKLSDAVLPMSPVPYQILSTEWKKRKEISTYQYFYYDFYLCRIYLTAMPATQTIQHWI